MNLIAWRRNGVGGVVKLAMHHVALGIFSSCKHMHEVIMFYLTLTAVLLLTDLGQVML